VLERGTQSIINIFDSDNDGIPDSKQTVAFAYGLNHGLAIHDGFIYASSDSMVYRWPNDNTYPLDDEAAVIVINNINEDGNGGAPQGHTTRTLEFDDKGWLYVSVGSSGNVDANSYRSRIRRVDLSGDPTTLSFPQDFQTMEVFADGLRNEVGLAFDKHGALWGVENSADRLQRDDLGGDIHENNVSNYCQYIIVNLLKSILFFKTKSQGIEGRQRSYKSNLNYS
jgi:glucose/arabinose dehydrogenase